MISTVIVQLARQARLGEMALMGGYQRLRPSIYYLPAMAGVCAKQTLLRGCGGAQSIAADFGILMKDAIPDMAVGHKSSHAGSLT